MKRERESEDNEQADGSEESPAKRQRAAEGASAAAGAAAAAAAGQGAGGQARDAAAADDDDDERIVLPTSTTRSAVKKGRECPYLDTISRQVRRLEQLARSRGGARHRPWQRSCRAPRRWLLCDRSDAAWAVQAHGITAPQHTPHSCHNPPRARQTLDFDFEKCCSVSLSPLNVYACLVCGKYFQVCGGGAEGERGRSLARYR